MSAAHVYLLLKHPRMPLRSQPGFMDAALIVGSYASADKPNEIATEKNKRASYYHYSVKRVKVNP